MRQQLEAAQAQAPSPLAQPAPQVLQLDAESAQPSFVPVRDPSARDFDELMDTFSLHHFSARDATAR